jgi:hypothetical protein
MGTATVTVNFNQVTDWQKMQPQALVDYACTVLPVVLNCIKEVCNGLKLSLATNVLWHADPLLDNDCEISTYTTAVAK